MNTFIWCAVGVVVGFLATLMLPMQGRINRIESIVVAIFGAFIGGEFVAAQFSAGATDNGFRASSLGLAVAGAVVMLVLLGVMRRAVGPMAPRKVKRKNRY